MKRLFASLAGLLCLAMTAQAQQTIYVCDGFGFDSYEIESLGDITFPVNDSIILGTDQFLVSDIDSITFTEPVFPKVLVQYNGNTATVTIPAEFTGVTCTSGNSSHVVLTNTNTTTEYLFSLTGSSTDGSFTIDGSYKMTLELDGVELTSSKGAAIDIECGKRIDVLLKEGTTNTFADCANGSQKGAFYTKGHLEFKGGGTLNLTGNTKHALFAKEYIKLKGSVGTINILSAQGDGIHCGKATKADYDQNYFQMNGGNVTISNCVSDCIDSDDYGSVKIKGGTLNLNISGQDVSGILCDSIFTQSGGTINIDITKQLSSGIHANYVCNFNGGTLNMNVLADGCRGVRSKACTKITDPVRNGGNINLNGTNVVMTISGQTLVAKSQACCGIKADKVLTQTAGDVSATITSSAKAIVAATDNWIGGTRDGQEKP